MKLGPSSFYKKALSLALPVMAQMLIQNMVSLIDNFMVAGLGDIKMSGVNIAGQINFIFLVFINNAMCASGGIFMSQYNGARDKGGMQQVFRYKLLVCVFSGILYMVFCLINPGPVLALMVQGNSAHSLILEQAVRYERIIAWTWIPMTISTVIASSLRETGKVRIPLIISVIATLVNTAGNYILIYGNFGAPRLEVAGAALATILARFIEMLVFIFYINKVKPDFYSRLRDIFHVRLQLFRAILSKSGLILVSEMAWILSETVTTALYNSRGGAEIVSGMAAGFAIANLFFISFSGIFTATGVLMGGALGAGNLKEARTQKGWILSGTFIYGIFFAIAGCASVLLIPFVFANLSQASRSVAQGLVFTASAYMPLWCYINAQFAVSRTGGDAMMGALVDLITNAFIVVPGMFAMTYFTPLGPVALYAVIKLSDFVKLTIASLWLRKERWLKNLTAENAF